MERDSDHPQHVRQQIIEALAGLGASTESLAAIRETLLVRDGAYYGRSYRAGGFLAMWLAGIGFVQIYGPDGAMLETVELTAQANDAQKRTAA